MTNNLDTNRMMDDVCALTTTHPNYNTGHCHIDRYTITQVVKPEVLTPKFLKPQPRHLNGALKHQDSSSTMIPGAPTLIRHGPY